MNQRLQAMEELDSCVFSSDMFYVDTEYEAFKLMLSRWQRAVDEHEAAEAKGAQP